MKTKYFFTLFIFCIVTKTFSQTSLNDYKYIIVPSSYDFLTTKDQYQLSSLTKFLFNKYGFTAIMEDEVFLQDLINNGCLALRTDVEKMKGVFKTKLMVVLKNCKNEIIFTSEVGEAREVDYKKAYHLALRDAFKSFETINYSFKPNENIVALKNQPNTTENQEVEKLKKEIKSLKTKQSKIVRKIEDEKNVEKLDTEIEEFKAKANNSVKEIEVKETTKEVVKTEIPLIEEDEKTVINEKLKSVSSETVETFYVQEIENGFQVVDATQKGVMILIAIPKQDTFIVKGRDAIVYKEDGFWYLSENKGNNTTTKVINIKF